MNENFTAIDLKSYCEKLSKTDLRRFKSYLAMKLDISYFTVVQKMNGRQQWKPAELIMISLIISTEEWKN